MQNGFCQHHGIYNYGASIECPMCYQNAALQGGWGSLGRDTFQFYSPTDVKDDIQVILKELRELKLEIKSKECLHCKCALSAETQK